MFCPNDTVTREQMAIFLDRALDLPDETRYASDDNGHAGRSADPSGVQNIWGAFPLAAADHVLPERTVLREQMAMFLDRGLALPDRRIRILHGHEARRPRTPAIRNIGARDRLRLHGDEVLPEEPVTRGQMAAFLHRAWATDADHLTLIDLNREGPPPGRPLSCAAKGALRRVPVEVAGEEAVHDADLVRQVEAEGQRQDPGRDHQPAVDLRRSSAATQKGRPMTVVGTAIPAATPTQKMRR